MNDTSPARANSTAKKPNGEKSGARAFGATLLRRPAVKYGLMLALVAAVIFAGLNIVARRPLSVQVASVEKNVPIRVFGLGTVEARVMSKIGFEVGATLTELNADHGDRVTRGQVLARLNAGEQEAKIAKARAAVLVAEVNVRKGAANIEKSRAVLAQKQEANRRKQTLVGRNVVSEQSAEEAARDEAVAKADVTVAESEAEVTKAQVADAKAQLLFEETLLRHRTLLAPYDAIVIERHKEPGTVIKAGDPIFTLVQIGGYWGLAHVDEARAGYIEEGQPVESRLRSRPLETFQGRVLRIGLESDRVTEERRVYLRGENPPDRVFLGEQVEFLITVAQLGEALLVPEAAVQGYDGRQGKVWMVVDGRLSQRVVNFRHRTEDARLEIVDGVPQGARVVTRIDSGFTEGRSARVAEARRT